MASTERPSVYSSSPDYEGHPLASTERPTSNVSHGPIQAKWAETGHGPTDGLKGSSGPTHVVVPRGLPIYMVFRAGQRLLGRNSAAGPIVLSRWSDQAHRMRIIDWPKVVVVRPTGGGRMAVA
ncbi:hypothetical protein E3N88_22158 [Mikania micrantha]|uniref:Uncharacterized protein n=1 Tax=Mikania micrantha TaxID=192012 RepID=A0A5N6NB96_9ASTR|nr:hypothetical protein E3N88_22158 [Mikania micrantha]